MIRCPQCGCANALGHIFCTQCRAKLDIETLGSNDVKEAELRPVRRRGRRLVWFLVFAGIVLSAALALWPIPLEGRKGTAADAQQARKKILLLEKGLSPGEQLFSEREVNAYLGFLLCDVRVPPKPDLWTTVLQAVEVVIRPNAITISTASVWGPVTVWSLKLGPWSLTSQITVVPEKDRNGIRWTIKNGRIGHLPLPGPLSAPAREALHPLLRLSLRERVLLADATSLELEEGQVALTAKKRSGKRP